jgi:hypothetical protein
MSHEVVVRGQLVLNQLLCVIWAEIGIDEIPRFFDIRIV